MPRLKIKRQQDQSTAPLLSLGSDRRRSLKDSLPISPERAAGRPALRVLVVDDNSTSQQAMRRMIMNAGMLCDVAGRGLHSSSFQLNLSRF